jgi:superfamily II DNA or RNA helicase
VKQALYPYQEQSVNAINVEWQKGIKKTLLILPTGCHEPSQLILTATGEILRADEIKEGMLLQGINNTQRKVLKVVSGKSQMYKIIPVKGTPFIVTHDHVLSLVRTNESTNPKYDCDKRGGEIVDVTVSDWLKWSKNKKHIHKLFRSPADFTSINLDDSHLHPYALGVLLGDGYLNGSTLQITTPDIDIVTEINNILKDWDLVLKDSGSDNSGIARTYNIRSIQKWERNKLSSFLESVGLRNTKSGTKFIPTIYSRSSRQDRLELLAGILDTDGHYTIGGFDYISKSERLANDVVFVCRSLGLSAYVNPSEKYNQFGVGGIYYRVSISGDCSIIPNRIPRKKATPRLQKKDVLRTGFKVEYVGEGQYNGFTVDGDNRYLLGDFTVTHNCGKTTVFSEIIDQHHKRGQRVLMLAHREELLTQAMQRVYDFTGYLPELDKAEKLADTSADIVMASVQTLRTKRLERYPKDHFDLIVVDEAHHASADSYKNILSYFDSKVLGVTATPDRADEKSLGDVFDSVAYQYSLIEAIKGGFLANIKGFQIKDFEIDLSELRTSTGKDYSDSDLENVILKYIDPIASGICNPTIKDLKSIAFLPTVKSASILSKTLNERGVKADFVSGETDSRDRQRTLLKFKSGEITHLINCAVLTEGFDEPSIQNVIIARPTKSRGLYSQMVGRGTRKHHGKQLDDKGNPFMYLTEFSYSNTKHKLVTAYELFASKGFDERVREKAAKLNHGNFLENLEFAHDEIFNIKKILSRIKLQTKEGSVYDPFALCDAIGIDLSGEFDIKYEGRTLTGGITPKQVELLQKHKMAGVESLTKAQASILIDKIAQNGWRVENILKKVENK